MSFAADTAHTYYIAVDGKNGAAAPYAIALSSPSCPSPICSEGVPTLSCQTPIIANRNDAAGATSDVSTWGNITTCASGESGPEFAHLFTPPAAGQYTIHMNGLQTNLDLIVFPATSPMQCSLPSSCDASSNGGVTDEEVTFTAQANTSYWVVVDGKNGATGQYFLELTSGCP